MSPERRRSGDDLTGRRQGYDQLKAELHHFFRLVWAVIIAIGVTSTLALVGYGFALREVQNQRREVCTMNNKRHDDTYAALTKEAAADEAARPTEKGKAEVRRRRDVTLGLIDLLAPKVDCDTVVETGFDAYWPW